MSGTWPLPLVRMTIEMQTNWDCVSGSAALARA